MNSLSKPFWWAIITKSYFRRNTLAFERQLQLLRQLFGPLKLHVNKRDCIIIEGKVYGDKILNWDVKCLQQADLNLSMIDHHNVLKLNSENHFSMFSIKTGLYHMIFRGPLLRLQALEQTRNWILSMKKLLYRVSF